VIRTANLFGVDAVEKVACDFFIESLEPSTACEALAFAAEHVACGEHARGLHKRCVAYMVEHFAECSVAPSFLELPCAAVAEVIGSDDLPVEEAAVLAAVRAWSDHDAASHLPHVSLEVLLPLVRWPLLPVETQLQLSREPLLQCMVARAPQLGMQLLTECIVGFAASDAAAACPRLKWREGTVLPVLPLAFTALSQQHYTVGEDGALLTCTGIPDYRAALCRERVMNSGQSCAEVTVVQRDGGEELIGVARPTIDPNETCAFGSADFWGVESDAGYLFHNGNGQNWQGRQSYDAGDVLRLLLDSDAGTLTVKKNGTLLGVAVPSGLTGDLCWAVSCSGAGNNSVRIKALAPAEF
jgi:hypothetical protein